MSVRSSLKHFFDRPRSSAALSSLLVVMGIIFMSDLLPVSPNRKYFSGHAWLLASACWALALAFGYCAFQGFHRALTRHEK